MEARHNFITFEFRSNWRRDQVTRLGKTLDGLLVYGTGISITDRIVEFLDFVHRPEFEITRRSKVSVIGYVFFFRDRLCGLVVRVLGYRSGGPGSIPDTIRKKM
jgi:hypothetical protein